MSDLPDRCPICYDSHDNMTYCSDKETTNGKYVCKNCYCYGSDEYAKILWDKELTDVEAAKLSLIRIRSLECNLKAAREKNSNGLQ